MELIQTFNKTMNDFILSLKKFYPEETKDVSSIEDMNDTIPLQHFMKSVESFIDMVSQKNEGMFENDIYLIPNCNLKEIWDNKEKANNHDAIWKFLHTLVLLGSTIRSKSHNLEQFFEQFTNMEGQDNFLENQMMNILNELTEKDLDLDLDLDEDDLNTKPSSSSSTSSSAKDTNEEEKEIDLENDTDEYAKIFENTKIGNLANEIAKDIDMSAFEDIQTMESPDIKSVMEKLVGGGGLKNLIQSVASKLKNKMASGDVNQDELLGEVTSMMDKMKNDKRFKKMFKTDKMQDIFKDFMKNQGGDMMGDMMGGANGPTDEDFSSLEEMFGNLPKNARLNPAAMKAGSRKAAVRNRLKKRLETRQSNED